MSNYLWAVAAGITVAAITGLTVVAYRHPMRYRDLALIVLALSNLGLVFGLGWNVSNTSVLNALFDSQLLGDKYTQVAGLFTGLQISLWWMVPYFVAQAYVMFLLSLRKWLSDES